MDTPEYTTLAAPLKGVPDPRQRRGQHYPWPLGKRLSWPGVRQVLCRTCRRGSWRRRWTLQ